MSPKIIAARESDASDLVWLADAIARNFTTESHRVIRGKRSIRPRPGVWWLVAAIGAVCGFIGAGIAVWSMNGGLL